MTNLQSSAPAEQPRDLGHPAIAPTQGAQPIVVVGIDGSAASDQALLFAAQEAQLRHAVLRIVASHDVRAGGYGYSAGLNLAPYEDGLQQACESLVKDAADTVASNTTGASVLVETTVVRGRASQVLLEAAKDAALLVVGARGAGAFTRLMMGSTCTEVVHHARVPVTVVPGRADEATQPS
jgi:nucleotide-binding universal stress UspA family protein